jgi:uncharacterized membrane protein YeaQ/YmgE (transglycosylase-associated protein family)
LDGSPGIVMKTNAQQGLFLNIAVGILGALLGGWFLAPMFGTATINQGNFSLPSLLVSFLGAIVLLAYSKARESLKNSRAFSSNVV